MNLNDFQWEKCTHGDGEPVPHWLVCRECATAFHATLREEAVRDRIDLMAALATYPCDFDDGCPPGHPTHSRCVPCKCRAAMGIATPPVSTPDPKPPTDLGKLLHGQRPGAWVVLDHDMTRVIGTGDSPEAAMDAAGITEHTLPADADTEERPVMVCVPGGVQPDPVEAMRAQRDEARAALATLQAETETINALRRAAGAGWASKGAAETMRARCEGIARDMHATSLIARRKFIDEGDEIEMAAASGQAGAASVISDAIAALKDGTQKQGDGR